MVLVQGIAKANGKYLLVHEKRDFWHIPSGKVEFGETLSDAIVREVREETGANCKPIRLFKIKQYYHAKGQESNNTITSKIHFLFEIKVLSNILNKANEHTLGCGWFTLEEIRKMKSKSRKLLSHLDDYEMWLRLDNKLPLDVVEIQD